MLSPDQQPNKPQDKLLQLLAGTPGLWRGNPREEKHTPHTPTQSTTLREVSQPSGDLFAGIESHCERTPALSTGFNALDQLLPGGGWPASGLVEIVSKHKAIGELQLLMPLLRLRSQQSQSLLWITPPYKLHGPALAQSGVNIRNSFVIPAQTRCNHALWSIEKALQSTECAMVLAWQNWLSGRVIRRLQMAAIQGKTLGVLFHQRPTPHSPATLQLELSAAPDSQEGNRQINIRLLRAKGSHRQGEIQLQLPG
jgi:hypothetical protein